MRRALEPPATPAPPVRVPRPLLKWAGGKRQLLPVFRAFYPERLSRYYEPFLGSGAVFFDLFAQGRLASKDVHLADSNADLIACYTAVRDAPDSVIAALTRLEDAHTRLGERCYYSVRERFNRTRLDETGDAAERAAMLIYLNRTGFNGLFRVNARGAFNVPAGRYERPRILDASLVRATAAALAVPGVSLARAEFGEAVASAGRGDLVYFDPPYAPLSPTAAFGSYTTPRFGPDDQRGLRDTVLALAERGAHVLLSNSSAPGILTLYLEATRAAGLSLWRLSARRAINSRPGRRGPVHEVLLTTLAPRDAELPGGVERIG